MNTLKFPLIILLVSIIGWQCQQRKENKDQKNLPFEVIKTIEKRISEGVTPSIAFAVIDSSGIHYYNFGKTFENGKKVNENTIYEIGSMTKVFTAIMLAKQVLHGDLKLDDKINDMLPDSINVPVKGDNYASYLGSGSQFTAVLP